MIISGVYNFHNFFSPVDFVRNCLLSGMHIAHNIYYVTTLPCKV